MSEPQEPRDDMTADEAAELARHVETFSALARAAEAAIAQAEGWA